MRTSLRHSFIVEDCLIILRKNEGQWTSARVLADQTEWCIGTVRRHLKLYGQTYSIERRHAVGYRINKKFYAQK
jgi:hypothetical protein